MGTFPIAALVLVAAVGCSGRAPVRTDAGRDAPLPTLDAPALDAAALDARVADAPALDARALDARALDAARLDAPPFDARASVDARADVRVVVDAGQADSPRPDAAACVLGTVACSGGYTADTYVAACSARELHVLGVYEPTAGRSSVPVEVTRTGAALTIVVSSYEAVSWDFTLGPGVVVERVVLNGFSPQAVTGLDSTVTITNRSGPGFLAACAYEWPVGTGGCATEMLIAGVEPLVGLSTTSFTGCYQASTFTIADP